MGIIYVFLSIISFGFSNCLWKYPLKKKDFLQIIILRSFLTAVLFGVVLAFSHAASPSLVWEATEVLKAVVLCIFSFFGLYFYVKSLKAERVSIAVPVSSISGLFGMLTAVLFLKEQLTLSLYVSTAVLLPGVFMVNGSAIRAFRLSRCAQYNVLAAFFWGVSFALFVFPVKKLGIIPFSFILEATVCACSIILLRVEGRVWSFPIKQVDKNIIMLAGLGFGGVIFYNLSLLHLSVSLISLLSVLTPVVSVAAAAVLFNERLTAAQYVGVGLIVAGLVILNIG